MNINMLRDSDNDPGFYAAASGTGGQWPGAVLFRSSDNGANYQSIATFTTPATLGRVVGTLGGFNGGNIPDELNRVVVSLEKGTLSSVSYASFLAGAQGAVIGGEIVLFRNAVLNVNGTYTLSGFLRGRRGSEAAIGTHIASERFVLIDPSSFVRVPGVTADLGMPRLYKAVTAGSSLARTAAQAFTNFGAGLKPYAPVQLGGGREAGGAVLIRWTRRSRISGEWRDGVDVPLGEDAERYEVEICDASYTTVKRTIAGLTTPQATYSAADQTADGAAAGAPVYVRVYQLSSIVGRGYPALATI